VLPLYATAEDVRRVLARDSTKRAGTAAVMEDNEINVNVIDAESEINARLRGRYSIPFVEPIPLLVHNIAVDFGAYLATLTYRQGRDLEATDPVVLRYNRARQLLGAIADGKADLDTGDGGGAATSIGSIGTPINRNAGKVWSADDFGLGWAPNDRRWRGWQ
jgi:phage gp36-like protein